MVRPRDEVQMPVVKRAKPCVSHLYYPGLLLIRPLASAWALAEGYGGASLGKVGDEVQILYEGSEMCMQARHSVAVSPLLKEHRHAAIVVARCPSHGESIEAWLGKCQMLCWLSWRSPLGLKAQRRTGRAIK